MDPQLAALSAGASSTLVTLMVTDGWQQARDGAVRLWRQFRPERAEGVAADLDTARAAVVQGRAVGAPVDEAALRGEWAYRIVELLAAQPDAEAALRAVLADWEAAARGQAVSGGIHQDARATGSGRVYQAGRDQHITER
ncbi:hypothetical protein [Streptomyces sp. NRRL F-5123]|uniref:hypothetical protein n=1 Tax=Streptomyces sp. NRRL F-5123 TaxID=1463856 RepID=UPI0004E2622A|nr:hypothetical protein [Streptomyces sp. NRRL F-5123]